MDKKQRLIECAFALFYRQGIHAVGINQILIESKVAKKTLYHHFKSKDDLILATLKFRDERFFQWLEKQLTSAPSGRARLLKMFDALHSWINNKEDSLLPFQGCFFINTCAEFGDQESSIHRLCAAHKQRIKGLIKNQVKLLTSDAKDIHHLTETIALLKEGAITCAHVNNDKHAAEYAKVVLQRLLPIR